MEATVPAKHAANPSLQRSSLLSGDTLALNALNGAAHHLNEIKRILAIAEGEWSDNKFDTPTKLLDSKATNAVTWHTRSVFWELVGVSDMLLQWANARFELGLQESQVRWSDMKNRQAVIDNDLWLHIRSIIETEMESAWYFEVATYRNFSHRSHLSLTTIISRTRGPVDIFLEPARVGAVYDDIRTQLGAYIEAMKDFGGKVFLARVVDDQT
jgi:hypothetical protein